MDYGSGGIDDYDNWLQCDLDYKLIQVQTVNKH